MSKTVSVIKRNNLTEIINDNNLNFEDILKNDLEIIFLRSENSKSFLKFFNYGYKMYLKGNYKEAIENLKSSSLFEKDDFITKKIITKMATKINRTVSLLPLLKSKLLRQSNSIRKKYH